MLFDLQPLDVDDGQDKADQYTDTHKSDPDLHFHTATESHVCNH